MMESTWETRDLSVLDAAVRYLDEHPAQPGPTVADIAQQTGLKAEEVFRAVRALDGPYLDLRIRFGSPSPVRVLRVTDEARRAVGQWPSPDVWADRIVQALQEAADREPDQEKRSRLRATAEGLAGFGRDVLVGVLSGGITRGMGLS
jgi:hypothetical protein